MLYKPGIVVSKMGRSLWVSGLRVPDKDAARLLFVGAAWATTHPMDADGLSKIESEKS